MLRITYEPMAKKVTIYDIADKLHLSPSTVSRALADSSLINIKTRNRIRKVAEEMGYRDSRNIQTEPDTIAVIVPARDNVFYNSIIHTIQGKIEDKYLLSVMCSDNSAKREKEIVSRLSPAHIRCLIISQSMDIEDNTHLEEAQKRGIEVILFNRIHYAGTCPKFLIDNYMDSYTLTRHLVSAGYRRIAFAAKHYKCPIYKERVAAYKDVIKENDLPFDPRLLIYSELTTDDTSEVISRFLKTDPRPDAIVLPNFISVLQAVSAAKLMNLSIPQDIAIASFDETPECKFSNPSVTCLSRPLEEIGEEIADTALRLCNGELTEKDITRVFGSRLIIRGSSFSC